MEHIAGLARLEFDPNELESLTTELNAVLGYIDQLKEADVLNVAPLENLNESIETPVLRSDEVKPSLPVETALRNAPKAADQYFLVPKVLAQDVKAYVERDIVGDEEEEL